MKFLFTLLLSFCWILSVQSQQEASSTKVAALKFAKEFIELIKQEDYREAYKYTDDDFSVTEMTFEEFLVYFKTINTYFGDLLDYSIEERWVKNTVSPADKDIRVMSTMNFGNVNCHNYLKLEQVAKDKFKIDDFTITTNKFKNSNPFDYLSRSEIDLISQKDFETIYKSSPWLSRLDKLDKFQTDAEKMFMSDTINLVLSNVEINVRREKTTLELSYKQDTTKDRIILEYVEKEDSIYFNTLRFYFDRHSSKLFDTTFQTLTYFDSTLSYGFEYPSTWVLSDSAHTVVLVEPVKDDIVFPTIFMITSDESHNLKKASKTLEREMSKSKNIKNLKLKSKSQIEINGLEAIEYKYTGRIGVPLYYFDTILIQTENRIYSLSTISTIDRNIINKGRVDKIINTFTLK